MEQKLYNGQAAQDLFVLKCLNYKRDGYFLEIGSNDPININNSYLLEKEYGWKGIMVEYESKFLDSYKRERPNSNYIIGDATKVNYYDKLREYNFPTNMDYLQIDLEVSNRSTLTTLENVNSQILDTYKFAVVTFEHDIYVGNYFDTRNKSREIFEKHGYFRVFSDVDNGSEKFPDYYPFEDWYVHPDLVDMNFINKITRNTSLRWGHIIDILNS